MIEILKKRIPELENQFSKIEKYFESIHVPAKAILLREGETSKKIFFIKKGCLRLSFNHNGKDITFQFFFENEAVSSIESFKTGSPSQFSIESIEPSDIFSISKKNFIILSGEYPVINKYMQEIMYRRLAHYSKLFLEQIKNTPKERYIDLLENEPRIIQRIPQHYIASYLGITPVSLSRIRKSCNH